MVNQIMTYNGVFPTYEPQEIGQEVVYNKQMHDDLNALMPNVFGKSGFIDVYAIVNRAERVGIRVRKAQQQAIDAVESNTALKAAMSNAFDQALQADDYNTLHEILKKWQASEVGGNIDKEKIATHIPTFARGTVDERYQGQQLEKDKNPPAFFNDPGKWISTSCLGSRNTWMLNIKTALLLLRSVLTTQAQYKKASLTLLALTT